MRRATAFWVRVVRARRSRGVRVGWAVVKGCGEAGAVCGGWLGAVVVVVGVEEGWGSERRVKEVIFVMGRMW